MNYYSKEPVLNRMVEGLIAKEVTEMEQFQEEENYAPEKHREEGRLRQRPK